MCISIDLNSPISKRKTPRDAAGKSLVSGSHKAKADVQMAVIMEEDPRRALKCGSECLITGSPLQLRHSDIGRHSIVIWLLGLGRGPSPW